MYDGRDPGLENGGLITQMIRSLLEAVEAPPREIEGVSEEFCDGTCQSAFLCSVSNDGLRGHDLTNISHFTRPGTRQEGVPEARPTLSNLQ